jgi:cytoskeleton protein RodZ
MTPDILGLRDWRRRKGVALDAISQSTKLSIRLLEAIECGDFRKLPGGIYNTNYIRQYARAIGFDEATLLAHYYNSCQPDNTGRSSQPAFQH